MLQFTTEEVIHLREKVKKQPEIIEILEKQTNRVRENLRIPKTGIGTWSLYYACPKHSVTFEFNIKDSENYVCPVDGEVFTGEPYTGAWWCLLNDEIANACRDAGLLYLLLQRQEDFDLAFTILEQYATYFPDYEVHGGIPYNNPGKTNSQTLSDATWINKLAVGYDLIRADISEKAGEYIERRLFKECADFLMEHRTNQIHNHEIIVSAAVGNIGLMLDNKEYLDFALESEYGLKYQLKHGVLADGFWFEGTPSYHFFAMEQYILFEHFARHTNYTFLNDEWFRQIQKFPFKLMQPDGMLPLLNDAGISRGTFDETYDIYELMYNITKDNDYLLPLTKAYKTVSRNNTSAFFFGADLLPEYTIPQLKPYHSSALGGSGITTMLGDNGRYLLVKHSPYGGEHDHYDRLALHFTAFSKPMGADLGTSYYGAPMHYSYYKNTMSHNTVCINGENQPPSNCQILHYKEDENCTILDTQVKWDGSYEMLDSFTIKQWSEEAYKDVTMRRVVIWYGDFFVDIFKVDAPEEKEIDWIFHLKEAKLKLDKSLTEAVAGSWYNHGAGAFIENINRRTDGSGVVKSSWDIGDNCGVDIFTYKPEDVGVFHAKGPDNPSVNDIEYYLQKIKGNKAVFVNVISAWKDEPIVKGVRINVNGNAITTEVELARGKTTTCEYLLD